MSGQDGDNNKTILGKTLTFPQKVATTVSAGQQQQQQGGQPQGATTTYRTINQPHMRLVMPASGSVPTPQIIQTHLMPQAMLKSGRLQVQE